jgi:hypothetical protein
MTTADAWTGDLAKLLEDYEYQQDLTQMLDSIAIDQTIEQARINEIALWKLNRYACIGRDLIEAYNQLVSLAAGDHRGGESTLCRFLATRGVDLAMASTLLRFRNRRVFQILDRHSYRALYGEKYPLYPRSSTRRKVEVYFTYLDDLISLAKTKGLAFESMDRVLYQFDKTVNGTLPRCRTTPSS